MVEGSTPSACTDCYTHDAPREGLIIAYTYHMKDALIVIALSVFSIAIGAYLYFGSSLSQSTPKNSQSAGAPESVSIPFTVIASGDRSRVKDRKNFIITSESELQQLWKLVDGVGAVPTIDFAHNQVAAVFAGEVATAGYSVAVTKIADANKRVVTVTIVAPGSNCMLAEVQTAPYQIIELPKTELPMAHADIASTSNCIP